MFNRSMAGRNDMTWPAGKDSVLISILLTVWTLPGIGHAGERFGRGVEEPVLFLLGLYNLAFFLSAMGVYNLAFLPCLGKRSFPGSWCSGFWLSFTYTSTDAIRPEGFGLMMAWLINYTGSLSSSSN